jgi:hypothetical protein
MFSIEMLPAAHGDCLLIEYGTLQDRHRVLVDGGTPETFDVLQSRFGTARKPTALDLMVITHVDEDHIGGALALLAKAPNLIDPAEIWFNSYRHLFRGRLGPAQGEGLATAIEEAGWSERWNAYFHGGSVVVPDEGLVTVPLPGGAEIVLLSPRWKELENFQDTWEAAAKQAHLIPGEGAKPLDVLGKRPPPKELDVEALAAGKFHSDRSPANATSIAFLLRYGGKSVLLGADAHPAVLLDSLGRLGAGRIEVDACKVAHHGSRANTSQKLLEKLVCPRFLVSTSGDVFGHPDPEAIARIVRRPGRKTVHFNYETDYTLPWAKHSLCEKYGYGTEYPDADAEGLTVPIA